MLRESMRETVKDFKEATQLATAHLVLRRLIEGFDLNWNKYRNCQNEWEAGSESVPQRHLGLFRETKAQQKCHTTTILWLLVHPGMQQSIVVNNTASLLVPLKSCPPKQSQVPLHIDWEMKGRGYKPQIQF